MDQRPRGIVTRGFVDLGAETGGAGAWLTGLS